MTTNPFSEAGSILAAIKRSEKQRDTTIGHAQDRHYDRVQRILAEASPEARELVVTHLKPGPHAAQIASEAAETVGASDDLSTIAPSLREPVPPLNAIVKERNR